MDRTRPFALALTAISLLAAAPVRAACPSPAAARATGVDVEAIRTLSATRNFTLGTPKVAAILPDGDVLFLRTGPRSLAAELFELDAATGTVERLASAEELVEGEVELSAAEKATRERARSVLKGIAGVETSDDGSRLLIPLGEELFLFDRGTRKARRLEIGPGYPDAPRLSPDGRRVGFVRDGDLWVADVDGGTWRKLTARESPAVSYGQAEFVAQEELDRLQGFWFSPDGERLLVQRTDEAAVDVLYVADPSNPSVAPTPFRYPRAGRANALVELRILLASGGEAIAVEWDRAALPYLRDAQWPRHGPPTLVVMNRAQTEARVLAVDVATGATRTLLVETDPAWVEVPRGPHWLDGGRRFAWSSERSGEWRLELRAAGGALLESIAWPGFDGAFAVDDESGEIWLSGSPDPTETHLGRLRPGAPAVETVTRAPGRHGVEVGARGGTRVEIASTSDGKRSWTVFARDGRRLGELPSVAEAPAALPRPALETVEIDGRTHHASIVRPRDFDPEGCYPVLLQVYAGPTTTTVWNDPYRYLRDQLFADTGFVVVRSDNRGTPLRGRDWQRVVSRDLISVALDDQVAVLRALAARHPELDGGRAGVVGWSFGGYFAAMAAIRRPDVFKAAVAGAPVTDWRFYDSAYTERYMGLPDENAAAYDATSAVVHATELTRPLMLVHGWTDDNVHVVNTLALANALLRAGKAFDLVLQGSTHVVVDPEADAALLDREIAFFRRHLSASAVGAP